MSRKLLIFFTGLILSTSIIAQPDTFRMTQPDYIDLYKNDAIKDMQKTGVPASITLAQGLLESESGNSDLAREARNHFGIKCHKDWQGETFHKDDDAKDECFRKYNTVLESFDDHSDFLRTRDRYAFLFELDITDYKGWAHGLKKAGYATNPEYAKKLIKIIEDYNLNELDKGGNSMPVLASAKKEKTKEVVKYESPKKQAVKIVSQPFLLTDNNVEYVLAKEGDSYFSLATENNIMLWQVLKYNDLDKTDTPRAGEVVYIKPKRASAKQKFHIAKEGEDMRYISQLYAVKLKKLYRYNEMTYGQKPEPGQKIILR